MTLKKIPRFDEMTINKDVGKGSFDLALSEIEDPDNAIVKYTYLIYYKLFGQIKKEGFPSFFILFGIKPVP